MAARNPAIFHAIRICVKGGGTHEENDGAPAQLPAARAAYTPLTDVTGLAIASTVLVLAGCAGPQSILYSAPPTEVRAPTATIEAGGGAAKVTGRGMRRVGSSRQ